jgi:hypothetical protein
MAGRMSDARVLVRALADPASVLALDVAGWTRLLTIARAEQLIGSLADRVSGLEVPAEVTRILADARESAIEQRRTALWEAEMARRALAPLGCPIVLLKGTAYVAAGLAAGRGRSIGDLDILVPRDALDAVEHALIDHGWEWVKPDPYDDAYYRRWMHELPPLIHRERDRMIDVHHTILPLTARPRPDAAALLAEAVPLGNGLSVLSREGMVIHAAAHLFADGDLAGGLRNLWDIDRLVREFGEDDPDFAAALEARARDHQLWPAVARALRLAHDLYGAPVAAGMRALTASDRLFRRRLLARDGWGLPTRPATRLGFYVRSHWLRMPPAMLARHLWIKWRRGASDAP